MGTGSRREARERALSLLYEAGAKDLSASEVLSQLPVDPDAFAVAIVRGVEEHGPRIDDLIARSARGWDLERMATVDRIVLSIATYELLERLDAPVGVVISEAVELAKQYSTEDSGRFVNGVLSTIAAEVRAG